MTLPAPTRCLLHSFIALFGLWALPLDAAPLQVIETDATITIRRGSAIVLVYNKQSPEVPASIDPIYRRSGFLHPVASPAGSVLTAAFPADHPHQQGIFTAWTSTTYNDRPVDFWNLAKGVGRVSHERVEKIFEDRGEVGFEVDLLHKIVAAPTVDVLREHWKITAYPTDGSFHCFDLDSVQQALTDQPLVVEHYHYGGAAVRGPQRWIRPSGKRDDMDSVSEIVNEFGVDRIQGNHQPTRWVTLTGTQDDAAVSITMLGHAQNFRAPQPARLHPTKPYFCFAPCVEAAFEIDAQHPYEAKFRFLVTDSVPEAAWLEDQWQAWCGSKAKPTGRQEGVAREPAE